MSVVGFPENNRFETSFDIFSPDQKVLAYFFMWKSVLKEAWNQVSESNYKNTRWIFRKFSLLLLCFSRTALLSAAQSRPNQTIVLFVCIGLVQS